MVTAAPATMVSQIAGVNDGPATLHPSNTAGTSRMNFNSGDLAIPYDRGDGVTNFLYGDCYGAPWAAPVTAGPVAPAKLTGWRANSLLVSTSEPTLAGGVAITDCASLPSSLNCETLLAVAHGSVSCIPTGAVAIEGIHYAGFMDVTNWNTGVSDMWTTAQSFIATSADNGQTWTRTAQTFPASYAKWQQLAFCVGPDGYLYIFGTPAGRHGVPSLARLSLTENLVTSDWDFWDGTGWTANSLTAAPLTLGTMGELSVRYDATLGMFVATWLDGNLGVGYVSTAAAPQGPWSAPQDLFPAGSAIGGYGVFQLPQSNATDLWFTVSQWGPYQTYLLHSSLS